MRSERSPRTAALLAGLIAIAVCLPGCMRLPKQSTPTRSWVLSAPPGAVPAGQGDVLLGVGPVTLPRYLDRPEIVERLGESELRANGFDLWGERLDVGFQRVLAADVERERPDLAAVPFPWKGLEAVALQLALSVARFEHDVPSGGVVLEVSWQISDARERRVLVRRRQTIREPVAEGEEGRIAAVVAAMSRAVGTLAREVAGALAQVPPIATTPASAEPSDAANAPET